MAKTINNESSFKIEVCMIHDQNNLQQNMTFCNSSQGSILCENKQNTNLWYISYDLHWWHLNSNSLIILNHADSIFSIYLIIVSYLEWSLIITLSTYQSQTNSVFGCLLFCWIHFQLGSLHQFRKWFLQIMTIMIYYSKLNMEKYYHNNFT